MNERSPRPGLNALGVSSARRISATLEDRSTTFNEGLDAFLGVVGRRLITKTIKKLLSVHASSSVETQRACAIAGNAGNMMLVAKAPREARLASMIRRPAVNPSSVEGASDCS